MAFLKIVAQRSFLGCAILILGCLPLPYQAGAHEVCGPSEAVQTALDALPRQTPADTDWDFHQKYLAALRAIMRQHADDIFVQRRYVDIFVQRRYVPLNDMIPGSGARLRLIEEYKAKAGGNPGSAPLAYLYGLTLVGRQSPDAIKQFDAALHEDPNFPWPHLALVDIYSAPAFRDKAKAEAHLRAFLEACPAAFEGYQSLSRYSDNNEAIRRGAAQLRSLVENRSDIHAIAAYETLWALEFKAAPLSEYDPLRNKTARDVRRIRALNLTDKPEWYEAFEDGYKLAGDQKNADWAKEEQELHFPAPLWPASLEKWFEDHHDPGMDATAEARHAYYTAVLGQTNQWIKERPNSTYLHELRLDALRNLDGIGSTEIESAADQLFAVAQKNAGPPGPSSYDYFSVARSLSKKHLQPSRVVEMAQKGLEKSVIEEAEFPYDLWEDKDRAAFNFYNRQSDISTLGLIVSAHIDLKQADKTQVKLLQMDERLQELKSLAGNKKEYQKSYLEELSAYWGGMARLAELQDRKLDAMAFYENALITRLDAEKKPVAGENDELAEDAKKLWSSLGGTDEGWTMWYGRRANELARLATLQWENTNEPLPAFELVDLSGKSWNLGTLKGKTTFLNFWASW